MTGIFRFLRGTALFRCEKEDFSAVIGALMARGIYFFDLKTEEKSIFFRTFRAEKRAVLTLCGGFPGLVHAADEGLPALLVRYRKRPGIPLGALLCAAMLLVSENFIWAVDVSGNENTGDAEVISYLESLGVGVGSYIPSLDLWEKCNEAVRKSGKYAFLSVNLEGTTAHIVVIERKDKTADGETAGEASAPSNLVASRAGKITGYEISSGQLVKTIGATVSEGEILVSGIVNTKRFPDDTFRLERSVGRVRAETVRAIGVEVPLKREETVVKRSALIGKSVVFFGKEIKFFKKCGNREGLYDIMEKKQRWVLFASPGLLPPAPLPIVTVLRFAEKKETVTVPLTEEEAAKIAWERFWERYGEETEGKEILSLRTEEGLSEDGKTYRLDAFVGCLEDIAREVPIGFEEIEE